MKMRIFISAGILFLLACTGKTSAPADQNAAVVRNDTTELIRSFVCGLWSLDSQNILSNEGYLFNSDGTMNAVAGENSGEWSVSDTDSIHLTFSSGNKAIVNSYRIDSLNEQRMVWSDKDGYYTFRKVPFGMDEKENVITGFHGSVFPGDSKPYVFEIPNAKKVRVALNSANAGISMKIYDGDKELTSAGVRNWQSIMVRSGKYTIVVVLPKSRMNEAADFDIKVFAQ